MQVQDDEYNHINRTVHWASYPLLNKGDILDVGDESNSYFRFYETQHLKYSVNVPNAPARQLPAVLFLQQVAKGNVTARDLPATAVTIAKHLAKLVRELVWEDVRRREFPHLPSRQRCTWLIPSLDGVPHWLKLMEMPQTFQVVKLRVQGRIHVACRYHVAFVIQTTFAKPLFTSSWLRQRPFRKVWSMPRLLKV